MRHGLEAHRGGGVVEAEHVRADVHEHGAHDGVAFRNLREKSREERLDYLGENLDGASLFADFENAKPKAKDAREAEGDFECRLGHVECAETSLVEDSCIAECEPLDDARDKCTEKENEPNDV